MTPFEFDRREVIQGGMASSRVVPGLDPGEDFKPGLGLGLSGAPGDEFAFETGKEALGHGVIVGITHRAHRRAYPMRRQRRPKARLVYWLPGSEW